MSAELLVRLEAKMDQLSDKQTEMNVTLVKQEANVAEHMRRTDLLEEHIGEIRKELSPIKAHVAAWGGAGKVLAVISALSALAFTIWKFTGH